MSRKILKEEFLKRFHQKFPEADIDIIQYDSLKKPCILACKKCGKTYSKARAEGFLTSWKCCGGKNESKIAMIIRLCEDDGNYKFIKSIDSTHVIIKHLICGNENIKTIQSATSSPCSCQYCNTQSQKLRISLQDAQTQLDQTFGVGTLTLLNFDGVDSKKSQYRCNNCGLIFNQAHYNLITKCRGCPKCDQRRSKGERAMRKILDENKITYKEQYHHPLLPKLSFDFAIFEGEKIIALIEIQGDQHYREVFRYPSRPNYFITQQTHDQQKRDMCKEQGILLYEIYNDCGKLKNLDIVNDLLSSTTISAKESTP